MAPIYSAKSTRITHPSVKEAHLRSPSLNQAPSQGVSESLEWKRLDVNPHVGILHARAVASRET